MFPIIDCIGDLGNTGKRLDDYTLYISALGTTLMVFKVYKVTHIEETKKNMKSRTTKNMKDLPLSVSLPETNFISLLSSLHSHKHNRFQFDSNLRFRFILPFCRHQRKHNP